MANDTKVVLKRAMAPENQTHGTGTEYNLVFH